MTKRVILRHISEYKQKKSKLKYLICFSDNVQTNFKIKIKGEDSRLNAI